ncbi:MAG: RNA polymerase-binding protein DksA [Pseudomonadota bacterium]|nr:RNA polymerase-binding protein DksA [Pseudomonadota bacterium]
MSTSAGKKKPVKAAAPTHKPSAKPATKKAASTKGKPASPAARKAAPARPAPKPAKKAAKAPVKLPVKAPVKAPAKAVKTTARPSVPAPAPKPAATKRETAPASAAVGKAAAKTAAAKPPMPAAAGARPVAKAAGVAAPPPMTKAEELAAKLLPGASLAMPPGVVPRKPGRGTPKYFVAPVQAPLPPPTSRFADRFAPPRPPTREMNKIDSEPHRQAPKADPKLANAWKGKAGKDLNDDEVLAMPEAEYMNEKQREFFAKKLQTLKDDLLSNAGETTEHLREDTSIVPDPADRATIEEEHALELRTRDRERKLLKKITQSLSRIESGDYGFCDETGEPIGLGRLIARPTATLSLEAQQRRELKQKMFGD